MATRAGSQRGWGRAGLAMTVSATVLITLSVAISVGTRLAVNSISDAICGSYNFISNDFCDEWNVETPPGQVLPVPAPWKIEWQQLDCGSGGCGIRTYVLSPAGPAPGGVAAYLQEIRVLGWRVGPEQEARRGDLHLFVEPITDRTAARLVPRRYVQEGNLLVSLAICGEGAICEPSDPPQVNNGAG